MASGGTCECSQWWSFHGPYSRKSKQRFARRHSRANATWCNRCAFHYEGSFSSTFYGEILPASGGCLRAAKGNIGWTALIVASQLGHLRVVREWFKHTNLDVNARYENSVTCLWVATCNDYSWVIETWWVGCEYQTQWLRHIPTGRKQLGINRHYSRAIEACKGGCKR